TKAPGSHVEPGAYGARSLARHDILLGRQFQGRDVDDRGGQRGLVGPTRRGPAGAAGAHGRQAGRGPGPGPGARGAPGGRAGRATWRSVEVRPGLSSSAAQGGAPVICLVVGGAAVGTAIQSPAVGGRGFAIVVGGISVLVGLGRAAMLRRVPRTRRYSFTAG